MKQVVQFLQQQNVFVEAHIADLHFGVIDPRTQYQILNEQFLNYIDGMNVLDIVSVNGDIFDHKFMANSDSVVYAIYFMNRLVDICRKKNASLILISGTGSHDADQLKLFSPLMRDPTVDVRVIFEAQFIYVKGKKILCIPELYNKGEEYYTHFLMNSGTYDACYMHGTFMGAIAGKNEHSLDSNREPVFNIEDFGICRGPIIAGHNHVHSCYRRDFYYCGSPIRWQFGEEGTKGFIILLHNTKTRQYLIHQEPITSFRYDTVCLDVMLKDDPRNIVQYIQGLKDQGIDYIRIKFTQNEPDKIAIIKSYYHTRSDIKIETDFEQAKIKQELDQMNKEYKQYDYLFDKNLTQQEILVQYINQEEKDSYWTVETLTQFLHDIEKL
jgi:DNA repair exonuclease SbcCD nuclease subunit